jgi:hypothetical protein
MYDEPAKYPFLFHTDLLENASRRKVINVTYRPDVLFVVRSAVQSSQ